jgi:hypothetical protein
VHVGLRYCYSKKLLVVKTSDLVHPANKYLICVSGIKKSPFSRRLSYLMKLDSKNAKKLAVLPKFSVGIKLKFERIKLKIEKSPPFMVRAKTTFDLSRVHILYSSIILLFISLFSFNIILSQYRYVTNRTRRVG